MTGANHGERVFAATGIDVPSALTGMSAGGLDPTGRRTQSSFARAVRTPLGPGTLALQWRPDGTVTAEAWGPGSPWLLEMAPAWCGVLDRAEVFAPPPGTVREAARRRPGLRIGRSGVVWQELVPAVLGQRVTGIEAARSWSRLVRRLGEPAPGPLALRMPPSPEALAGFALHDWHLVDVERKRAEAVIRAARLAHRLEPAADLPATEADRLLRAVPGIGAWTAGTVLAVSHGDPDAVPVGDYHLPSLVTYALAGEPKGTDERMLELLEPYAGQRWRACRLLLTTGVRPPRRAPRARLRPIRWH